MSERELVIVYGVEADPSDQIGGGIIRLILFHEGHLDQIVTTSSALGQPMVHANQQLEATFLDDRSGHRVGSVFRDGRQFWSARRAG